MRRPELVLGHAGFPSAKSRDDHTIGWTEIMAQLARLSLTASGSSQAES